MIATWICYFSIYSLGCFFAMACFLMGRTPSLNERNWPWPVIFLWPLLVLWPLRGLAGFFRKSRSRKQGPHYHYDTDQT